MAQKQLEIRLPVMVHTIDLPFSGPFYIEFALLEGQGSERTLLGKIEVLIADPGNMAAVIQGKKMTFLTEVCDGQVQ